MGFLFQNAALFDSITVGENVAFPLRRHTKLPETEIRARAQAKLDDVGLGRDYDKMPADLSGGMRKRAGLARAMALDPSILLGGRAERRPRPDHVGRDRRVAARAQAAGHHARDRHAQHPERAHPRRRGRDAARRTDPRAGNHEELAAHEHPMVRTFMRSEGTG
jgi:hypothetical protein